MLKRFIPVMLIATLPLSPAYAQATRPAHARRHGPRQAAPPATQPASEKPQTKETQPEKPAAEGVIENAAVTQHEIHLREGLLKYTATAADMLMKDEEGKVKARVFFVAYEKEHAPEADLTARPVTFVFNGGPGAAAVWLHLGAAGPQRVQLTADGDAPAPPYRLIENPCTWLDATDLVFIDPVGTGFSRPGKGESPQQFYGVREDIASVADFIRLYITRYGRWLSPHFLAGESYGTTRAAGLSEYLLQRQGIALNGIVLISSALDFSTLSPSESNELPYALYLPTYAAVAWYHHQLAPDLQADLETTLQQVEQWAMTDYRLALGRGSALSAQDRRSVVEHLARFTSLPPDLIERADLRIDPNLFEKRLLSSQNRVVGRFDSRITGPDADAVSNRPTYDPSLSHYLPLYTSTFNDYVRRVLNYQSTLPYEALSGKVGPWKFDEPGHGYLNMADNLRDAMIRDPHLKVLFASGYFDLATPYLTTAYTVDHMNLPPDLRANIQMNRYLGGHMMYHNPPSLKKLHDDITAFVRSATAGQAPQPAAP